MRAVGQKAENRNHELRRGLLLFFCILCTALGPTDLTLRKHNRSDTMLLIYQIG